MGRATRMLCDADQPHAFLDRPAKFANDRLDVVVERFTDVGVGGARADETNPSPRTSHWA